MRTLSFWAAACHSALVRPAAAPPQSAAHSPTVPGLEAGGQAASAVVPHEEMATAAAAPTIDMRVSGRGDRRMTFGSDARRLFRPALWCRAVTRR